MSGSSGGGSGKVDYPTYMKTKHEAWLNEIDALIPSTNPYLGKVSFDPDTLIAGMTTYVNNMLGYFSTGITSVAGVKTLWQGWVDDVATKLDAKLPSGTYLQTAIENVSAAVIAGLNFGVINEFEGGMRDINAVQSAAFTLGKAMLLARVGLETSRYASEMTLRTVQDRNRGVVATPVDMIRVVMDAGNLWKTMSETAINKTRMNIIAKQEQFDKQLQLDLDEAKWPLEEFQYAGNLLASIGGAASGAIDKAKPNPYASALGGAVSGAAMGAAFGPWGAAVGAVVGGVGGYLSAQ